MAPDLSLPGPCDFVLSCLPTAPMSHQEWFPLGVCSRPCFPSGCFPSLAEDEGQEAAHEPIEQPFVKPGRYARSPPARRSQAAPCKGVQRGPAPKRFPAGEDGPPTHTRALVGVVAAGRAVPVSRQN